MLGQEFKNINNKHDHFNILGLCLVNLLINLKGSRSKITLKDCLEGNGKPARTLTLNN